MVVDIPKNICVIRERIASAAKKSGRREEDIKLIGVTKFHPLSMLVEASPFVDAIGENRVQEAALKKEELNGNKTPCAWHMIGRLQKNKARRAIRIFDMIESVDSLDLAVLLNKILAEDNAKIFPVLIEVNISREINKGGMLPEETERLLCNIMEQSPLLSVQGFMTVARNTDDERELRNTFAALRILRDRLKASSGLELPELSMGMSGDFETAIEEGSTMVRIGSAIFGPRNY
ncbi:MAG: YggS family pyridoxal phosphate-dependent enzyme [Synergistes sp.]|nr:YggS family pyridoxal phosphate-dependent enzyme [Synergistes sp.]